MDLSIASFGIVVFCISIEPQVKAYTSDIQQSTACWQLDKASFMILLEGTYEKVPCQRFERCSDIISAKQQQPRIKLGMPKSLIM